MHSRTRPAPHAGWKARYVLSAPAHRSRSVQEAPEAGRFEAVDAYDGLLGATQQTQPLPTLLQTSDGKLWFATSRGPVWVDPKNLAGNDVPPPVAIRSLTANGKRYESFADLRLRR